MSAIRHGIVIAGKYRLEARLGQGGMGSVWSARHLSLDTPLAIKFINAGAVERAEARKRFEREAKAAALLQSPHVVQILDYGVDDDVPYIVMERLVGEDLSTRLARADRLTVEETVNIVAQVARALRRASEAGIVHRDLKPGNIFLVRCDDDQELVKVLDFGVAKASRFGASDDTTQTGALVGSPRYMSPEQAQAKRSIDHRSDLWSLAVIAFRALTGEMPFRGDDVAEILLKICGVVVPVPSEIVSDLDPDFDVFFRRAFERAPEKRFQSARELSAAFARAAGVAPPSSVSFLSLHAVELLPLVVKDEPRSMATVPESKAPTFEQDAMSLHARRSSAPPLAPSSRPLAAPRPSAAPTLRAEQAPLRPPAVDVTRPSYKPDPLLVHAIVVSAGRATTPTPPPPPALVAGQAPHEPEDPKSCGTLSSPGTIDVPPPPRIRSFGSSAVIALIGGALIGGALCTSGSHRTERMPVAPSSPAAASGTSSAMSAPSPEPAARTEPLTPPSAEAPAPAPPPIAAHTASPRGSSSARARWSGANKPVLDRKSVLGF